MVRYKAVNANDTLSLQLKKKLDKIQAIVSETSEYNPTVYQRPDR